MRSIVSVMQTVFAGNRPGDWPYYIFSAIQWQIRKRLGHSFKARLENGAVIKVYPSTAYSGIFYARNPEGKDMEFIRKHAYLADTFVDVGANVGLFSASLFDKFQKVICFEPAPSSFRALTETCALNPHVSCELHNIGVGDSKGELFFEDEFEFSTTSRFVAEEGENTIRIPVDTLDHVLNGRFDSMVMKTDVEGYEEKVFLGADDLFRRQRVKLLMFERLGRTSLPNARKFLEDRGYVIFRVNSDLSATTDDQAVSVPCINLFACPRNSFARLGK